MMKKLLLVLFFLPFVLDGRAEDPPSMIDTAVVHIKKWDYDK